MRMQMKSSSIEGVKFGRMDQRRSGRELAAF